MKPVKQSELFNAIGMSLGIAALQDEDEQRSGPSGETDDRPLRILLAEDSIVNQKLAIGLLEKHGHSVVVAETAERRLPPWQNRNLMSC